MRVEAGGHLETKIYQGGEEVEHFFCSNKAKAIGYSIYLEATAMSIIDHAQKRTTFFILDELNGILKECPESEFDVSIQNTDLTLA
jgi:hypothetical protein